MKKEKEMVRLVIHTDLNGKRKKHYRVYEDLEKAKELQPSDQKCKVQIIRQISQANVRKDKTRKDKKRKDIKFRKQINKQK